APGHPGRGRPRRLAQGRPEPAALPKSGADPADPRPLDRQVQRAPRLSARGAQDATGGNCMTTITEIQTTQVYRVFIRATPEQVWDAITKPEFTEQYFHGVRIELRDGRRWSSMHDGRGGDGVVREGEPPRRLVHGWSAGYDPELVAEETSRVTWEIEPR